MALKVKNTTVIDDDRHIVNIVDYNGYVPANSQNRVVAGLGFSGGGPLTANITMSANVAWFDSKYTKFTAAPPSTSVTLGDTYELNAASGSTAFSYANPNVPSDGLPAASGKRASGFAIGAAGWTSPAAIVLTGDKMSYRSFGNTTVSNDWVDIWDKANLPNPVIATTRIVPGQGLIGGGDLSANVSVSVGQGVGIVVSATAVSVNAGNGLAANTTGVHVIPGLGIGVNASNVFVQPGPGMQVNANGVSAKLNQSLELVSDEIAVKVGTGLTRGANGISVLTGNGVTANATHIILDNTVARTSSSISGGIGLTGSGSTGSNVVLQIQPGLGISANTTGTHVLPKPGGGLAIDGAGVFVDTSVARTSTTISGGDGLQGAGNLGTNTSLSVRPGLGIVANTTGTHVKSGIGLSLDATGVFVNAGDGVIASSAGVSLDLADGLEFTSGKVRVKRSTTSGLLFSAGGLQVQTGSGLDIVSGSVQVTSTSTITANTSGVHVKVGNGVVADSAGVSVGQGLGITVSAGAVAVSAGNGLSANSSGVHVMQGYGLEVLANQVNVRAGNGVTVNSGGVHVTAGNGLRVSSNNVYINAGAGLTANATGLYVNVGNGINAHSTLGLYIGEGSGIQVNSTNVQVDNTVIRTTGNQTMGGTKTFSAVVNAPGFNATDAAQGFWGVAADSPANPSFTWTGSSNTGMWRSTDGIGFTIGGTNRAQVTAAGFVGPGGSITGMNASQLTDGTVPEARLTNGIIRSVYSESGTGALGTYALLKRTSNFNTSPGANVAASELVYASASGDRTGSAPSGTWKCMGSTTYASSAGDRSTVWLRIA